MSKSIWHKRIFFLLHKASQTTFRSYYIKELFWLWKELHAFWSVSMKKRTLTVIRENAYLSSSNSSSQHVRVFIYKLSTIYWYVFVHYLELLLHRVMFIVRHDDGQLTLKHTNYRHLYVMNQCRIILLLSAIDYTI